MESLYLWPNMPVLSVSVLIVTSMLFFYLAKAPIHSALQSLSDGTAGGFRKIADWAKSLASTMHEKNRKVLLESGVADKEQKIIEEFRRVEASYTKHLADYPKLHLKLDDNITKLNTDYKECGQVTLEAPGWSDVIESIAKVKGNSGDRVIEKMLSEIHKSAIESEKRALAELRNISSKRHKILSTLEPVWKKVTNLMQEVNTKIELVLETSGRIDKYMVQYEKIRKGGQDSIDMLSTRASKLFIFSLIVIAVAVFGALINFQLIALPMSELVPAGTRIFGMPVSEVAALVIVCLEVVLGIFFMEALGVTSIFPQITGMTRGKRRILLYGSLIGLLFLASVEAALAILRETIAEAGATTERMLAGDLAGSSGNDGSHIATAGQAVLGFTLPWILSMVAVALEMFIESSQHVLAKLAVLIVILLGHICRMISYLLEYMIQIIMHLYDAYIIIPLQIGNMFKKGKGKS